MKHRYIAVEGPIGVGKSTFADALATRIGAERVRDTEALNPWLEPFYRDPRANALHAQLQFLVTRTAVLERLGAPGARPRVADFMIEKDPLFAELTLDENEWRLYTAIHERLVQTLPRPDLVVCLQAPVALLIARIERRGIPFERAIDSTYLQRLAALYERFFHDYSDSPLLIVNTAAIDLANDPEAIGALVTRIASLDGGRHYFNPA